MGESDDHFFSAIDQVLFMQNTSPIPDEMLAHRLGLVPLMSKNVIKGLRYTRVSFQSGFLSSGDVCLMILCEREKREEGKRFLAKSMYSYIMLINYTGL